jgi:rhamnosyltransferase
MRPAAIKQRVIAIVVTYFPDLDILMEQSRCMRSQVDHIIIVDNTPSGSHALKSNYFEFAILIEQGRNLGLANGINIGLQKAKLLGANFVVLLDQDSLPKEDMVEKLMQDLKLARSTHHVAAAGPYYSDPRGAHMIPFWNIGFPKNNASTPVCGSNFVSTDFLITSGCLIAMDAIEDIGEMCTNLFIDNVDLEWCFRAKSKGWSLIGSYSTELIHQLGDDHVRMPSFMRLIGKETVVRHSATRLYYFMRNRILLLKMRHVPLAWKLQDIIRIPPKFVLACIIAESKREAAYAMLQGCWHGCIGVSGVRPSDAPG